jgi:hypothetical protein
MVFHLERTLCEGSKTRNVSRQEPGRIRREGFLEYWNIARLISHSVVFR